MTHPLLSTADAAKYLCISARTLERYRVTGEGPRFVKIGKRVAYRMADLDTYVAAKVYSSTSAYSLPGA